MESLRLASFFVATSWLAAGCGQSLNPGGPPPDGGQDPTAEGTDVPDADGGPNPCTAPTALVVAPASVTQLVSPGTPFTQAYTVMAQFAAMPAADVTSMSFLALSDATLGTFAGNVFNWGGTHGGSVTVSATYCGVIGTAILTLSLDARFGTTGVDPTTAETQFSTGMPSMVAGCAPSIVYPPDGVLLPPNTNVIEVHFTLGSPANTLFEISFTNALTTVRVYTHCTGTTAADGMPMGGGCVFELSPAEWDAIAGTNRDGGPVTVTVRGIGCDGTNVAASASRSLSFARDDLVGVLYYWASMRVGGAVYNSGGVFRYDYGVRGASPQEVLTPNSAANPNHLCIGCHGISRDGTRMVFDFDDNDADDEYSDVRTDIFDIITSMPATAIIRNGANVFPPGYHTWNRATTQFLLSDGPGNTSTPAGAFQVRDPIGTLIGYTQAGALRGTTPDWAPDSTEVAFAVPPSVYAAPPLPGYWMKKAGPADDVWFAGASLHRASWDPVMNQLGTPSPLITATGTDNYYYPTYSPEGSLIAFNHATSGANFHNPTARVEVLPTMAAVPTSVDLARLNDTGSLTNSWPRWAPFVQIYQGEPLVWITFSSTRNYGLRIDNTGNQNCYPTESPITPYFTTTSNCNRAQIWMAAVRPDATAVSGGVDPSWPAFWLPFQDMSTNNHLAQWAERAYTGPCTTDADCAMGCCIGGGCTTCPPPPPPSCTSDSNCAAGSCCVSGTCGACADGGMPEGGYQCNTCLDCPSGVPCVGNMCGGACTNASECCAPYTCVRGVCGVG